MRDILPDNNLVAAIVGLALHPLRERAYDILNQAIFHDLLYDIPRKEFNIGTIRDDSIDEILQKQIDKTSDTAIS